VIENTVHQEIVFEFNNTKLNYALFIEQTYAESNDVTINKVFKK